MKKIDKDGLLLCDMQAKAFELSVTAQDTSSEVFIRRFMNSEVAKQLDMTPRTFYNHIQKGVFGSDEIEKMVVLLDISDPVPVFFASLVT